MLTVPELAALFRVTEQTIHAWTKAGMKVEVKGSQGRGHASQIKLEDAVEWYFSENFERLELDRERTRLAREQADKTALENAERRKDVVRLSIIEAELADEFSNIRTNMLAIPRKLAPELEGMNVKQRESTIDRSVRECLDGLAAYERTPRANTGAKDAQARPDKAPAAAAADGKSVGRRKSNPKSRGKRGTRKVANRKG